MKNRIYQNIDNLHTKAYLFRIAHNNLYKSYKVMYITIRLGIIVLSLLIATFAIAGQTKISSMFLIPIKIYSAILGIASIILFILAVLSVALKLDEKIYVIETSMEQIKSFLKTLNNKLKHVRDQNMGTYKIFMMDLTKEYNKIIELLPSTYFLRINNLFCKNYGKLRRMEQMGKIPKKLASLLNRNELTYLN